MWNYYLSSGARALLCDVLRPLDVPSLSFFAFLSCSAWMGHPVGRARDEMLLCLDALPPFNVPVVSDDRLPLSDVLL